MRPFMTLSIAKRLLRWILDINTLIRKKLIIDLM